jgi:hypothetical protein
VTPPPEEPSGRESAQRFLRVLAAFVSPGIVGVLIIFSVLSGEPPGTQLRDSELVSSVALLVGAVLVLGSIALYQRSPEAYHRHQKTSAEQLQAFAQLLAPFVQKQIDSPSQPTIEASTSAPGGELPQGGDGVADTR